MALTFKTPEQLVEFLPGAPDFVPKDFAWQSVSDLAEILDLTDSGLMRIRKRFRHAYEHKQKNRTYIFCPLWLRLYALDRSQK